MPRIATSSASIGIWGGPGSGKTTYLGALGIAALREQGGRWLIVGRDRDFSGSTRFLAQTTDTLLRERTFPGASTGRASYGFTVSGRPSSQLWSQILGAVGGAPREISCKLAFEDRPGIDFASFDLDDPLWDQLATCAGLIYLYDSSTPPEENLRYLQAGLAYVHQRAEELRLLIGTKLPHFVAFCLSKYDEPKTFTALVANGLISLVNDGKAVVPQVNDPRRAFELVAGDLIATTANFFLNERVRYFATSSIGFYAPDPLSFNLTDCYNLVIRPGSLRIRGEARPLNVFTPLVWLVDQISR